MKFPMLLLSLLAACATAAPLPQSSMDPAGILHQPTCPVDSKRDALLDAAMLQFGIMDVNGWKVAKHKGRPVYLPDHHSPRPPYINTYFQPPSMFPSSSHPPTLHTTAPTPSTTLFTVSTRSNSHTLLARSLHYLALLLRVVVGVGIVVTFWAKWKAGGADGTELLRLEGRGWRGWSEELVSNSAVGQAASWAARRLSWAWVMGGTVVGGWVVTRRGYTGSSFTTLDTSRYLSLVITHPAYCSPEESLLVLRGLGIQTSSSSPTYLSTPTTRFIPTTAIQDIFIHEAFKGFEVRFYLAIVVQGEEDVVVVFPVSHESQAVLQSLYQLLNPRMHGNGTGLMRAMHVEVTA
ncbi:hypothetical protein H2201_006261 [Coniosporium apollinis]|uniref:Phosphatidylinositol N-acetylglucosaminyltransferase subunit H conserved domain-containing protein n=1 Tax=Coniosporium apollinis TaxID=61459 RepID=A0ABQ9NQS4_9PEZI|nr:hypothetical protein H2201_006261 [Coniosporium apollinis]